MIIILKKKVFLLPSFIFFAIINERILKEKPVMFNNLLNKAKEKISNIELDKVEDIAKKGKKVVRDQMKEHGVEDYLNKAKEEVKVFSDAVSDSAKGVYEDNKETLEKPVGVVSSVADKVSKHSEELKWAGGIAIAIVAPVTTVVATTAMYLLSDDDEEKKEVKETPVIRSSTSLVEIVVNKETRQIFGKVIAGKQKDRTFEEIGVENMKILMSKLDPNDKDQAGTISLIKGWLNWKEKN